jgi:aspartate/methionine/tyrosine aminotransferase
MTVKRLEPYAVTIFAETSALAARVGAVNLGQGFPDEDGPAAMLKTAENAIAEGVNQYPPGLGIAPLREAIAAQRKRHFGTEYDPESEVLVTVGATEAIAASVLGLVEPGSEVLLIEPFYDSYSPVIAMAGCHRRAVPMVPDGRGFAIDVEALRRAVNPRTKALILNSPHNPTGMVASDAELAAIADLAVRADLLVITDEVYEHLVFDGRRHLPLANYPGMADRTITISSAAKMFNVTGWKIGWACGAAHLINGVRAACGSRCRPSATSSAAHWTVWASTCTTASARTSCAPTPARSAMTTAQRSAPSCRRRPAWPRFRCRRSANQPTTSGITWCASRSASATTPWTRPSDGSRCFAAVDRLPVRTASVPGCPRRRCHRSAGSCR